MNIIQFKFKKYIENELKTVINDDILLLKAKSQVSGNRGCATIRNFCSA